MKRKELGVTMVEIMTVVAIIAILVGLLIPAVSMVRRTAKETQQKVQLTAIDVGLTAFKNDYGDYPPSDTSVGGGLFYCGAQKLAEALVGRDMRGFDPNSKWDVNDVAYNIQGLGNRRALYLDPDTTHAFRLGAVGNEPGLYEAAKVGRLAPDTFVLCDVYARNKVLIPDGTVVKETKLGSPILYYKADPSRKVSGEIYDYSDNDQFIFLKEVNGEQKSPWGMGAGSQAQAVDNFHRFIRDPRVPLLDLQNPRSGWPHRPDSYILVTAGADGIYGTSDDICNFSR